jgi:hypothetical protein
VPSLRLLTRAVLVGMAPPAAPNHTTHAALHSIDLPTTSTREHTTPPPGISISRHRIHAAFHCINPMVSSPQTETHLVLSLPLLTRAGLVGTAPPVGPLQLRVGRGMAPPAALLQLLVKLLGRVPADQLLKLEDHRDPCCCCCLMTEVLVTGVTCSMDQTRPEHDGFSGLSNGLLTPTICFRRRQWQVASGIRKGC